MELRIYREQRRGYNPIHFAPIVIRAVLKTA